MAGWMEVEDLARLLCKLDEDADSNTVDDALVDRYDLSFDNFYLLIEDLAPFTLKARSPLTDTLYQGFVHEMAFVYKKEVE